MKAFVDRLRRLVPKGLKDFPYYGEGPERYGLLYKYLIFIMCAIALVPLVLMAAINYHQYRSALKQEIFRPLNLLITSTKHSLELFLTERRTTLKLIAREHTFEELSNQASLNKTFQVLKNELAEFVDLGLIDSSGFQRSYAGPYGLKGKNYRDQDWFREVQLRGVHVSDVFLGYRKFPHFVIAVRKDTAEGDFYILRATIDTEKFYELISRINLRPGSDIFIINRTGILQTPSRFHGQVLEEVSLPVPLSSHVPVIQKTTDTKGRLLLFGYAYLENSPFVLIVTKKPGEVMGAWFALRVELLLIFAGSFIVIILVALRTSRLLVNRIQVSEQKREAYYLQMEQTAKLASLGRLAAGVAHEINNPLAIINEKAGLMKDLVLYSKQYHDREKFLSLVDSILRSVQRTRDVTHRLLGFARHMDVKVETIYLNPLLEEVLGFLGKEALHRNIRVVLNFDPDLPPLRNDRGQLQQVFLNLINNSFEAVGNGGRISITTGQKTADILSVTISDNGRGIPPEHLNHIFEPFFTFGKDQGTGLGLSIAYGIVTKCGGDIRVESEIEKGTSFVVELPRICQLLS